MYGHPKSDLKEIAMRNRMKESGVEKAKNQAIQRLQDRCLDSLGLKLPGQTNGGACGTDIIQLQPVFCMVGKKITFPLYCFQ